MITWIIVFALALLSIVVFVFALRSQQDAEALEDRLAGTIDEEAAAHPHQAGGIEPLPEEYQIVKRRYSGFFGTDLEILLKGLGVEHIYAVGLLTDVCVHYTCADAHQHGVPETQSFSQVDLRKRRLRPAGARRVGALGHRRQGRGGTQKRDRKSVV